MSKYSSGARFERQIIKYLLEKGAVLVMRGAGSKSYGIIKADLIAIVPYFAKDSDIINYNILVIQAKHSKKNQKKAKEAFFGVINFLRSEYNLFSDKPKESFEKERGRALIHFLWLDAKEDWKKKLDEVLS